MQEPSDRADSLRSGMEQDIARLVAMDEIRRTILLYAHWLDAGAFEDWSDLFEEGAEFWSVPGTHFPGAPEVAKLRGRQAITESVRAVQEKLRARGRVALHFGSAPLIVLDEMGTSARAYWDFELVTAAPPEPAVLTFVGHYIADLCRGADACWRFRRRVSVQCGHPYPDGLTFAPAVARRLHAETGSLTR